jgi:hypothetical protein
MWNALGLLWISLPFKHDGHSGTLHQILPDFLKEKSGVYQRQEKPGEKVGVLLKRIHNEL